MKKNLPSSRLSSGSTLVVALLLLSNLLTANSSLFPFGNFDGKDNSERVFEEYVQAYQPLVVAPEWLFRDTELPPARATDQLMMAGVQVLYTNSVGGPLVKQDVTACDGMSLNQARFVVTNNGADNMTVTLGLPPGIFYEPGSISVVATSGGLTVAENDITDRSAPVFTISPADLTIGNSVTLQWDRRNGMTCDAYDSAIAGGIFKDEIRVTTDLGLTEEVDPVLNTYNLLFASLSLAGAAPVTTNVGSTVTRQVTITNGGLGFLDEFNFTIENGTGTSTTSLTTTNGTVVAPTSTTGTATTYTIPAAIIAEYGNNDNLFNNSEQITFTRTYTVLNCETPSSYQASWGCPDACMLTAQRNQQTNIANGVPDVVRTSATVVSTTNMCDNAIVDITVTNQGTEDQPGAGTAFSLQQFVGIGGSGIDVRGRTNIASIAISDGAGNFTTLVQTGGSVGSNPNVELSQLTTAFGGLIDADGDGQFDDLPVGASITMRVEIEYVCSNSCGPDVASTVGTRTNYTNQCGIALDGGTSSTGLGVFSRFGNATLTASASDVLDGETLSFEICIDRNLGGSLLTCPTNELTLNMAIPDGFDLASADVYQNGQSGTSNLVSANEINTPSGVRDTVVIVGTRVGTMCYQVNLVLNCADYTGDEGFTYEAVYQCDVACDCTERWVCGNTSVRAQCPIACPEGGLTMRGSDFERITYGYASRTSTAPADRATLTEDALNTALACDTVKGSFPGKMIADANGIDFGNGSLEIRYDLVGGNTALRPVSAELQFFDASNGLALTTVTLAAPQSSTANGIHELTYDLTAPLAAAGQVLAAEDSVFVCALYYVEKNSAFPRVANQLSGVNLRYYSIATPGAVEPVGEEVTCTDWGGLLKVARLSSAFFRSVDEGDGCRRYNHATVFRFEGGDAFPNEIRPFAVIDSIVFTINNNDLLPTDYTATLVLRADAAATTNLATFATVRDDRRRVVFVNDGSWPFNETDYNTNISVITSCESVSGGNITLQYYYQEYGYTVDEECREDRRQDLGISVANNLPVVELNDLTGTVAATTATVAWDIEINNTGLANAGFNWIAIEDNNATGLEVTSVTNTVTGTPYPLLPYADGVWVQVTEDLMGAESVQLTVTVALTDCAPDDLRVFSAWNCPGYPTDPTVSPCDREELLLRAAPLDSEVQIELISQPVPPFSLCTVLPYEVLLNSAQAADLDNPVLALVLRSGLLVEGSITGTYPNDASGTTEILDFTISGDTVYIDLESHTAIGTDGMPGTVNALNAGERQVLVAFSTVTNCDFSSGARVRILGYGAGPCGGPAENDGVRVVSDRLTIDGAEPQYFADLEFGSGLSPAINCSTVTAELDMTLVGLTSQMTSIQDSLRITLADGLEYLAGSFTNDGGLTFVNSTTNASGQTILLIATPATPLDITGGVTVAMSFMFDVSTTSGCNTPKEISAELSNTVTGLSCATDPTGMCAETAVILGDADADILLLKPRVAFGTNTSACFSSETEVTVTGTLDVTDQDVSAADNLMVEFFCADENGNPRGTAIGSYTQNGPVTAGSSVPFTSTFAFACTPENGVVARIGSDNCICSVVTITLPDPTPPVLSITAAASCDDETGTQVPANTYYLSVTDVTGGEGTDYEVTVNGVTQTFTGTEIFFGPFAHSGTGGAVQLVTATETPAVAGCIPAMGTTEVPEILCGINDGGQASGCFCDGPTTDPTVPTSFILAQSQPGTFMAGGSTGQIQKYVLVNAAGIITHMNLTGLFEVPVAGTYTPYAINYRADEDPTVMNFLIPGEPIQPVLDGIAGNGPLGAACFAACNVDATVSYESCSCYSVGSTVFADLDNNGMLDTGEGENGLTGVIVELYAAGATPGVDAPIGTTTTDSNGDYYFGGLDPADYFIYLPTTPIGYPTSSSITDELDNGEDNDDNGIQPLLSGNPVSSPVFTLGNVEGEPVGAAESGSGGTQDDAADAFGDMTQDFGFFAPLTVGDTTFVDLDMDGTQSTGDLPLANVTVTIYDVATGLPVALDADGNAYTATQLTDPMGAYLFENLPPGNYYVEFDISTNPNAAFYDFTTPNAGSNDATDSDAVPAMATDDVANSSATGFLTSGQSDLTLDAGVVCAIDVTVAEPFTICSTVNIDLATNASVTPASLAANWTSDGTGQFLDNADAVIATGPFAFGTARYYVPSEADKMRGYVILTLTTVDPPATSGCGPASDSVRIDILKVDCGGLPWDGQ